MLWAAPVRTMPCAIPLLMGPGWNCLVFLFKILVRSEAVSPKVRSSVLSSTISVNARSSSGNWLNRAKPGIVFLA